VIGQHIVFDIVAWLSAFGTAWLMFHWRFRNRVESLSRKAGAGYFAALTAGGLLGAYGFGTLNTVLSGQPGLGRSILGGLVGAIALIEIYKLRKGIRGSTGAVLAVPFCVALAIGRIGCSYAGLDDYTFGVPTTAPWGVDFGDGVTRHPVQIYEAATMLLTALVVLAGLWRRSPWFMAHAFYAVVFVYAVQRFAWEFLKPYATLVGPLNIFHFLCFALLVYTAAMVYLQRHDDA
jgi:phosphatidylglycerol:prolipoprotein diacylglycerol transferase